MTKKSIKISYILVLILTIVWIWSLFSLGITKQTPTGDISGHIINYSTKKPIQGAKVFHPTRYGIYTKTDKNGFYKLTGVPIGKYDIYAQAKGFDYSYCYNVIIFEAQETKNINFKLYPRKPNFYIYSEQNVFTPKETPSIILRGYMLEDLEISVYKITPVQYLNIWRNYSKLKNFNVNNLKCVYRKDVKTILNSEDEFDQVEKIPISEIGVYLCQIKSKKKNLKEQITFNITNLGLITKRSSEKLLIYTVNLLTSKYQSQTFVKIYQKGSLVKTVSTNSKGLAVLDFSSQDFCDVIVRNKGSLAFARVYSPSLPTPYKIYLYTERPVYRPGQKVYFKGILRKELQTGYTVLANQDITVNVTDPDGNNIYKDNLITNQQGSFSGKLNLPSEPVLGAYALTATIGKYSFYQDFKVAEYKKPEYKVDISTDKSHYICGDTITASIKAAYYFGAPVVHAKVRYTVYMSPYYREVSLDSFRYQGESAEITYGQILISGETKTDAKGQAALKIPTKLSSGGLLLGIQVEVEDLSFRTVTDSLSVPVLKGLFNVRISTDKYIYSTGEKVIFNLVASDFKGKLQKNVLIETKVCSLTYKEGPQKIEEMADIIKSSDLTTDEKGRAVFSFTPEKAGSYRLETQTKDVRGNEIKESYYFWVSKIGFGGSISKADLELIPDKKVYSAGQTAKLLINTSSRDSYVLLTIEGQKLFSSRLIFIKGYSKLIKIPVESRYFPNAFVCVSLVKDKNLISRTVRLALNRDKKYLKIKLKPEKEKYSPGEPVAYHIKITDFKDKPVSCEFSLGVVDEAIYAISPDLAPDIKEYFYGYRYNLIYTNYSFSKYYSGGLDKEKGVKVRRYFPDTAFFKPDLVTDSNGEAHISVKLPDNLTSWRATLRAASLNTLVGEALSNIISTKDLLVRLETPRFMTQKDTLEIAGVVHNYTKVKQKVKVNLKAENIKILDKSDLEVEISPQEAKRLAWKVKPLRTGTAKFTVKAIGETASDAMELEIPVYPFSIADYKMWAEVIKNDSAIKFSLPENIIPEATRLQLNLSSSLAGILLQGLDYLVTYPYGCTEQVMSSFLPGVVAVQTMQKAGLEDQDLSKKLSRTVKEGLLRLYKWQHPDGGWGWWQYDATHPYMTAYVVFGLNLAKNSGFEVNKNVLSRGVKALRAIIKKEPKDIKAFGGAWQQNTYWNTQTYCLYSLASCGILENDRILEVYQHKDKLNNYTKALLALLLDKIGKPNEVKVVLKELNSKAVETKSTCYWQAESWDYSWTGNQIETTAYVLKSLINLQPENPKIIKTLHWLVLQRQGNRWISTKDTASVIYVMCDYLDKFKDLESNFLCQVYLNDEFVKKLELTSRKLTDLEHVLDIPYEKLKSKNTISFKKQGTGNLYFSGLLCYFTKEKFIKPLSKGIEVKREYFKLKLIKTGRGTWIEKPVPFTPKKLDIGERLQVKITLNCSRDYQYLIIEDPLPAGCEVTMPEQERNWGSLWYCRQQVHDEKVAFFARELSKGRHELTYQIRAEIPGEFYILPAQVWCMYNPEIRGHSAQDQFEIR